MPIQSGLEWLNKIAPHPVRTVPQVIMNNEYIGGFAEVEKRLKEEVLMTEYKADR
jgi:glutaredoxin